MLSFDPIFPHAMLDYASLNRTTLDHWNYTIYSNNTISNSSNCWLLFHPYQPVLLANGTFLNATSCYTPILPIQSRGITGLIIGILFAVTLILTLVNLRKHGRSFLPPQKRWRAIGRRWQWYWMLFVAACGVTSTITGVDVDRDYVQSTAVVLQSFFYTLIMPGLLGCVWESVRHWGSWQERQIYDADAFTLPQNDYRSRTEFYLPLMFYLFDWLSFFMTIPRPWTPAMMQRSPEQTVAVAQPALTDGRFKAGAVFAFLSWLVVCYSLGHSVYHYKCRRSGRRLTARAIFRQAPNQHVLSVLLLAVRVGYSLASAWSWPISPYRVGVNIGILFGLGYAPSLAIVVLLNTYGCLEPNEDRALIAQRVRRDDQTGHELGLTRVSRKPSWWSKSRNPPVAPSADEMLKDLTRGNDENDNSAFGTGDGSMGTHTLGSLRSVSSTRSADDNEKGSWWWQKSQDAAGESSSRSYGSQDAVSARYTRGNSMLLPEDTPHPRPLASSIASGGSHSEHTLRSAHGKAQVVRSMLDV